MQSQQPPNQRVFVTLLPGERPLPRSRRPNEVHLFTHPVRLAISLFTILAYLSIFLFWPTNSMAGTTTSTSFVAADEFASLGDLIWYDADEDGVQDAEETGLSEQSVMVGIPGVQVMLYDGNNQPISSTVTGPSGRYLFSRLAPGHYSVALHPPSGYVASPAQRSNHGGSATFDSDLDPVTLRTVTVLLAAGERNMTLDAGLHLRRIDPVSIGNHVWLDLDRNGQRDVTESGVPGVDVTLMGADGVPHATTKTNALGFYHFAGLAPGIYSLEFVPPGGFLFTESHLGEHELDSDVDVQSGQSAPVTLTAGTSLQTLFAGLTVSDSVAAISGAAWLDSDLDGLQGAGEGGVPGVSVQLLDVNGEFFAEMLTANDGIYHFPNLLPTTYTIAFRAPGYQFTQPNVGAESDDSDIDPISGMSELIIFGEGELVSSISAGLVASTITRTTESTTVSLGDTVWEDFDLDGFRDADEPLFAGALVRLFNLQGELIAGVRSDSSGIYRFDNLVPGEYFVEFVLPRPVVPESDARYVTTQQGTNPASDVDSNPDPETARTSRLLLHAGESNLTIDAGVYLLIPVLNPTALPNDVEPNRKRAYLPVVVK